MYSLKVKNTSGAPANVAVYQSYPNVVGGLPLVWLTETIPDGDNNTFLWNIDWAISWAETETPLAPGLEWESSGPITEMQPHSLAGPNAMTITYASGEFSTTNITENKIVPPGDILVKTDQSFTVEEAAKMSIAIYMNKKPAFAFHGHPNGKTLFKTHPTYWLCTTAEKEGVAVSSMFVSSPKKVVFSPGLTSLSYELSEVLEFVQVKA